MPENEEWPEPPLLVSLRSECEVLQKELALYERTTPPALLNNHRDEWRHISFALSSAFDLLMGHNLAGTSNEGPRVRFVTAVIEAVTGERLTLGNVAHHLKMTKPGRGE